MTFRASTGRVPSGAAPLRRTAAAATAVGLALALAACGSDDEAASSSSSGEADYGELNLQFSWIKNAEFLGEYMADQNGYYEDAGFSSVNLVAGPSTGVAELVQGAATVAPSDA